MLCSICFSEVQQTFQLKDSIDTCAILLQTNLTTSGMNEIRLCCWCLKIIKNIDRFRRMALQAQFYFTNGTMSNYSFQPQNFYNLKFKYNIDHYDTVVNYDEHENIFNELNNCNDDQIKSELLSRLSTDSVTIKDEPEVVSATALVNPTQLDNTNVYGSDEEDDYDNDDVNDEDFEPPEPIEIEIFPEVILERPKSLRKRNIKVVKNKKPKTVKPKNIKSQKPTRNTKNNAKKTDRSQLIELNSFWMLKSALLPRLKTDKYHCILIPDNDILNQKKTKLEKLKDKEFKCLLCLEVYSDQHNLNEHIKVHSQKQNTVLCKFCNVWIEENENAVLLHYRSHYVKYKCNNCMFTCDNTDEMEVHHLEKHPATEAEVPNTGKKKEFKCGKCGEVFNTCGKRQYHSDTVHKKIIHQCDECNKIFKSYTHLRIHKDIHKNEYFTCEICGRTIKNRVSFDNHKKQHLKEASGIVQSVSCTLCNKTYKSKLTYRIHIERTHQPVRKYYKCPNCDKSFLDERTMEEHKLVVHLGGGVACHVCGRKFPRVTNLNKHLLTHGDKSNKPRNYVCDHCGKAFYTKLQMIEHSRIHSDERPLQCKKCSATFKYKAALFTHNRLVHEKFKRTSSKGKLNDVPKGRPVDIPFYPNYY